MKKFFFEKWDVITCLKIKFHPVVNDIIYKKTKIYYTSINKQNIIYFLVEYVFFVIKLTVIF